MSDGRQPENRVKVRRSENGWTQADLAERAGISRAAVSAVEIDRLVPSVAAALAIASALSCTVEELFGERDSSALPTWAWPPPSDPCRYWEAEVAGRLVRYPVETSATRHDGIYRDSSFFLNSHGTDQRTLVMASCDPAANFLAGQLAQSGNVRLLTLQRSSRQALELVRQGLVHVAGIHFATGQSPDANARAVKESLGEGYRLVRVAAWQEGLSLASGSAVRTVRAALRSNLRWVGREQGSAARQCQDELLSHRSVPRRLARDHRGIAEAVRCGWADIGVCLRLASEEAGLNFITVREENYDLCYPIESESDSRIQSLLRALRAKSYRRDLGDLPGYDTAQTGEVVSVT